MKKLIILASLTLLATSCSKEKWNAQEEGTTSVTVSINLPEFATKAYGSGQSATTLRFAVYLREDGSEDHKLVASGVKESAFTSLSATQSIDLAMGRTYDFVFWADSYTTESNSPYTFNAANKTVTIDYSKATAAGDAMDAFYGIKPGVTVSAGMNIEATLTRPFSQVNFGTTSSDLSTATQTYGDDLTTAVRMKAYTSFGLLSGEASGETENDVTFAAVAPSENESFPVDGYKYLAVAYALVNDAETKNITYAVLDGGVEKFSNTIANVPLKKNYRTNIYGSLITSAANVNVRIASNFDQPNKDYPVTMVASEAEFVAAVAAGEPIQLTEDITLTSTLETSSDYQIYLANNTLTVQGRIQPTAESNSTLSICGGKIVQGTSDVLTLQVTSDNTLELSDVVIESKATKVNSTPGRVIDANSGSNLILDNVTFNTDDANTYGAYIGGNATISNSDLKSDYICIYPDSNASITIENTKITSTSSTAIKTSSSSTGSLTLKNCEVTTTAAWDGALQPMGSTKVVAEGCSFTGVVYGFLTNGSYTTTESQFDFTDCSFSGQVAFLNNVNNHVNFTKCTLNGQTHGLAARGGTYVLDNCALSTAYPMAYENRIDDPWVLRNSSDVKWKDGAIFTIGSLVMGNNTDSGYRYPTNVTLKNGCVLSANHTGNAAGKFYLVYAYANPEAENGVTFSYDASTEFNTNTCKSPYLVYDSANITVNGTAMNANE